MASLAPVRFQSAPSPATPHLRAGDEGGEGRRESGPTGAGRTPERPLDRIDRRIVIELQRDATISLARLADRVGLSQTPCWKRVQKLEQAGVLTGRVALADPEKLGFRITAFMGITASGHGPDWREAFAAAVGAMPEIVEVWRMAGEADYLVKVVTTDMAALDATYRRLTGLVEIARVTTQIAMERVAYSTALPVSPDPA